MSPRTAWLARVSTSLRRANPLRPRSLRCPSDIRFGPRPEVTPQIEYRGSKLSLRVKPGICLSLRDPRTQHSVLFISLSQSAPTRKVVTSGAVRHSPSRPLPRPVCLLLCAAPRAAPSSATPGGPFLGTLAVANRAPGPQSRRELASPPLP